MLSKAWPIAEPEYRAPRAYFPAAMRRALARSIAALIRAVIGQGAVIGAASLDRHLLRDIGVEHPCQFKSVVQAGESFGG